MTDKPAAHFGEKSPPGKRRERKVGMFSRVFCVMMMMVVMVMLVMIKRRGRWGCFSGCSSTESSFISYQLHLVRDKVVT